MDIKTFYARQISLSEWFESFNYKSKTRFRVEDNEKRERLRFLNKEISIPFDKPIQFKATDLSDNTYKFKKYYQKHSEDYCALRLIPTIPDLPKLRMRGLIVRKAMVWYKEQDIDPKKYRAEFIPHSERPLWSTILIINKKGAFGEIIKGMHSQLTQGFYDNNLPILFSFDFKNLKLSLENSEAEEEIRKILDYLYIPNADKQMIIQNKFNASFHHNYLEGYFETISTEEFGLWFIDYNRILGRNYKDYQFDATLKTNINKNDNILRGLVASQGKVSGIVKIANNENISSFQLEEGEILVTEMTTPDHVVYMKKASAIITDKGGVLCHAAIIAREFGIPCIVATRTATTTLKNGDLVEVDATEGVVKILTHGIKSTSP